MLSKPAGIAVLVVGFMTAAAGGAYLAKRQQPQQLEPAALADAAPMAAPATVEEQAPAPVQTEQPRELPAAPSSVGVQTQAVTPAPAVRKRPSPRKSARVARPEPPVERENPEIRGNSTLASAPVPDTAAAPAKVEPQAPQVQFQELTIPSDTVIGVQVDTTVSSERARLEDRVDGRVTRDVTVGGRVAIPAGTKMLGSVTLVERGGKFKDRARIAVRFHTAQLADGSRIPLQTTAIMREGDSPSRESAAKVGGAAVGGAILGAILGGGKGAAIGGSAGAAGGTAVVMAGDRNAATLPAGTTATVRLMSDVAVTVDK
jgi:hypothetical protein